MRACVHARVQPVAGTGVLAICGMGCGHVMVVYLCTTGSYVGDGVGQCSTYLPTQRRMHAHTEMENDKKYKCMYFFGVLRYCGSR